MIRDTFDMFDESKERSRFGDEPRGRVNGSSDLHDLTLALHAETSKAILVSETGDEAKAKWIPKSQVEFEKLPGRFVQPHVGGHKFALVTVTLPEWLATKNGFV